PDAVIPAAWIHSIGAKWLVNTGHLRQGVPARIEICKFVVLIDLRRSVIEPNTIVQGQALAEFPVILYVKLVIPVIHVIDEMAGPLAVTGEVTKQSVGKTIAGVERIAVILAEVVVAQVINVAGLKLAVELDVDAGLDR